MTQKSETRIALYPGSFDPFTLGHLSIAERALKLFDRLVIAIGYNIAKKPHGPGEERLEAIRSCFPSEPRVEVARYDGLTVDFARKIGACAIVRGIRGAADFEYEKTLADVNRDLDPEIETVFLPALPQLAHISSSAVRELQAYGHDASRYLPFDRPLSY